MTEMPYRPPHTPPRNWQDQVDLLVERELSSLERRQLIELFDRHPERWRVCAMAFIERDLLRRSLHEIHAAGESICPALADSVAVEHPESVLPEKRFGCLVGESIGSSHSRIRRAVASAAPWLTAAVLVLILIAGLRFNWPGSAQWPPQADSAGASAAVDPTLARLVDKNDRDVWLQVNSAVNQLGVADSRIVALVEVARRDATMEFLPIIQSPTLAQQIAGLPEPRLPRDYLDQIQRAGWQLDTARQFLSFHFPDGRNQVMPVATHNYRYVGREVF